jgi:hypothetical protein
MNEKGLVKRLEKTVKGEFSILVNNTVNILNSVSDDFREYKHLKEQFEYKDDETFNLFKDLTAKDLDERFYSKILAKILNPRTPEIHNLEFLKLFQDLLYQINPNIKKHIFTKNVEIKIEDNFIDILIKDEKYAIIIENKIANAEDRPNQLARYYDDIINRGLIPLAIVYIPINPLKYPAFKKYTGKYKKMVDEIKKIYVHLPAIYSNINNKLDLAKGFIDKCTSISNDNKIAFVYISQFSKLIKYKGGLRIMGNLAKKNIVEAIFKNYETVEIANEIAEIWKSEKNELFAEILYDKLREKLKITENKNANWLIGKNLEGTFVWIWSDGPDNIFLGLSNIDYKNISKEEKEKYLVIFEDKFFSEYSFDVHTDNKKEISISFAHSDLKKSFTELLEFISEIFNALIELVKKSHNFV